MVSGTLSLTVYKAGLIDDSGFLVCVALGTIGGLLPDLDSDNSTPLKLLSRAANTRLLLRHCHRNRRI